MRINNTAHTYTGAAPVQHHTAVGQLLPEKKSFRMEREAHALHQLPCLCAQIEGGRPTPVGELTNKVYEYTPVSCKRGEARITHRRLLFHFKYSRSGHKRYISCWTLDCCRISISMAVLSSCAAVVSGASILNTYHHVQQFSSTQQ